MAGGLLLLLRRPDSRRARLLEGLAVLVGLLALGAGLVVISGSGA